MKITDSVVTHRSGRVLLHFLDDPDTPVIVEIEDKGTATYDCAVQCGDCDGWELSKSEVSWLLSKQSEANTWYNAKRMLS